LLVRIHSFEESLVVSFNSILCAFDFDRNSLLALRVASELTRSSKGVLDIFHVVGIPPDASSFEELETIAKRKLERLAMNRVGKAVQYRVHVTDGNPDVEIVAMAKRLRANMIVMATHGWKGLRRLLLGSVAEGVMREAPCPVLTVRPRARPARAPLGKKARG
jgi:nucleotide-binding universal stress UspA family protein